MSEFLSQEDPGHEEDGPLVDRFKVVDRMQELGIDIDPSDIDGLDSEGVIGAIRTYANMYDIDEDKALEFVFRDQLERIREFDDEV